MNRAIPHIIFGALALSTIAVSAQDATLRPAPEYFIAAVVASTTAQELARSCPTLSLDPPKVQALSAQVLQRLQEDGFDIERPDGGMTQSEDKFEVRQNAFLLKHGLIRDRTTEKVCAAGLSEMSSGTSVGALLVEVPQ